MIKLIGVLAAGSVVAAWSVPRAIEDWQFQLAGLADPALGRPAPGITVLLGGVVTAALVAVAHWKRRWRAALLWPVAGGWIAYGVAALVTLAGGGQSTYAGSLRYDFGSFIDHAADIPAVCRTPVGMPATLSEVRPTIGGDGSKVGGLPMLRLRHAATGEAGRSGVTAEALRAVGADGSVQVAYEIPGVADRPLPYLEVTRPDGTIESEPAIGFLSAYTYSVLSIDDRGLSGTAVLRATRWQDPYGGATLRWVHLEIPNDPWPAAFDLSLAWLCSEAERS